MARAGSMVNMRRLLDETFAALYTPLMRLIDRRGLAERRARLVAGVEGDVVEIGAGSGQNVAHYPRTLRSLTLIDPNPGMVRRLRAQAAAVRPQARVITGAAESLPLPAGSADYVVATLVLCSVADPTAALAEVRRILRPGGQFLLFEHVAGDGALRRVQQAIEPVQKVIARNCHLTRDSRALLREAGFDVSEIADIPFEGWPAPFRPGIEGSARVRPEPAGDGCARSSRASRPAAGKTARIHPEPAGDG
ncbi:MAG TPA: class I SAM-dependent methyltransferase [Egibacteraceae bacterium]|nr:class I SAM-dependent methyltransferase [Egibacteraceae bacterium]